MVGDALQWMAIYGPVARVVDSIGLEVISPNLCSFGNRYINCVGKWPTKLVSQTYSTSLLLV